MSAPLVQIERLHKSFNDVKVLNGVDISVRRGESIVVIGQSGCGKSVLLKHIIKLLEPDEGRILFEGVDLAELDGSQLADLRRRIGMLFQSAALFDSLTVYENVGLGLKESLRYDDGRIREIVMEKLDLVGLTGTADRGTAELSGGMRKRVGLARAIAYDPELLLYDEPTTGLDPITADMIDDLIVDLNRKLNVTSFAVTHDMKSAFKIASRIVMLYNGAIVCDGTPNEIRHSDDPVVQQFITGSALGPIQVR
ncbi:MAG TPA: ABC transporter ATP-binding protein [Candidatus Deferrimicrobium sp.]|nr:ABC transporter ATP-binding protein [Candidatus Deferrimicrobium sp.]